jgi:hypothetical protein
LARAELVRKDEQKLSYLLRQINSTVKTASSALVFLCLGSVSTSFDLARANEVDITYCPARPLLTRTLTSTRRFSARPAAVSLGAAGSAVPIAPGAMMWRIGTLQLWIR